MPFFTKETPRAQHPQPTAAPRPPARPAVQGALLWQAGAGAAGCLLAAGQVYGGAAPFGLALALGCPDAWLLPAVAGAVAASGDPAIPLNGAALRGLGGVSQLYSDNDIDLLVRGGVTPLEAVSGVVSPVRGITTRTTTSGAQDTTWRELTTILVVDNVIPSIRQSLRSRFSRSKNTAQTRGAIRSQVIVELENKLRAEIIDGYGEVSVSVYEDDPTVCLVEFSFAVAHGLNQIWLSAHITV